MVSETPDEIATSNWDSFLRAYSSGHEKYVELAKKCSDYYLGEQWDEQVRRELQADGRPALTLNEIFQVINAVIGHQSTMRADIAYKPKSKGSSEDVAMILTTVVDQILDANDYHDKVEPLVFQDGVIEDRGFIDVRMNFDDNFQGEVAVKALDPRSVVIDPDARDYDPATWSEVFIDNWQSLDDIEAMYGKDKRSKVESVCVTPLSTFGTKSVRYDTFGDNATTLSETVESSRIKAVRVIERQYRRYATVREFVDLATGEMRRVPEHWDEARVLAVSQQYGLPLRKRFTSRIRWTVTADQIVLHDDWSPYDTYTVVPYFPVFRRGRPSGLVRHLLDPQDQLNKIESQVLHVINTTANSGWVVEEGALRNMSADDLEARGAETGLVLVYGRGREKPDKIKPNTAPTGLENYASKALQYIHGIPGVSALLGAPPNPEVSGVALAKQQSRALLGVQMAFDNLTLSRKLLARRILRLIQQFYTEERVFRVMDWRNPESPINEVVINAQQSTGEMLYDVSVGEYDVVVGTSPVRDNFEETQFAEAVDLRRNGVMIPDHHVILASHLYGKRQIAEEVKRLQGLGEPTPEQQQLMQMQQELTIKTAMAQVAELEAKVAKLQSESVLNQAKAKVSLDAERRDMADLQTGRELELEKLKADVQKTMANLENKLQLASIHTGTKAATSRASMLHSSMENEKDRMAQGQQAMLNAMLQPTPAPAATKPSAK